MVNDGDDNGDCDNDGIMLMTTDILPPGEPVVRWPGPDAALEVDVVPLHKVVHQDDHVVYQDGHVVYQDDQDEKDNVCAEDSQYQQ